MTNITTVTMRVLYILAIVGCLAASAQAQQPSGPVGTWNLWAINGVAVSQQLPTRNLGGILELVAEGMFGEGNVWTETMVDSLEIQILPDGEYRARTVSTLTYVIRAEAYERAAGRRVPRGQQFVRETQPVQVLESIGNWSMEGDSIFLTQSRRQILAEYAATEARIVNPDKSPAELLQLVEESFSNTGLAKTTIPPRYAGTVQNDKLALENFNGLRFTLRKR